MHTGYSKHTGLFYRSTGIVENRPTLVFVHGFSGSCSAWQPYADALLDRFNVFMYDLRGHGFSPKKRYLADYALEEHAKDLEALLAEFHITQPTVIGHSFGSMILLHFVKERQSLIQKLILLSPGYRPRQNKFGWLTPISGWIGAKSIDWIPFSLQPKGQVEYYPKFVGGGDWYIPRMIQDVGKSTLHVYLYCFYQSLQLDAEPYLAKINVPTYVLHGKRDSLISYHQSEYIAQHVPQASLTLLDDACHVVVINNVDQVLQLINEAHSEPVRQFAQ